MTLLLILPSFSFLLPLSFDPLIFINDPFVQWCYLDYTFLCDTYIYEFPSHLSHDFAIFFQFFSSHMAIRACFGLFFAVFAWTYIYTNFHVTFLTFFAIFLNIFLMYSPRDGFKICKDRRQQSAFRITKKPLDESNPLTFFVVLGKSNRRYHRTSHPHCILDCNHIASIYFCRIHLFRNTY